ncbi:g7608 [Coccomyxa elongata]
MKANRGKDMHSLAQHQGMELHSHRSPQTTPTLHPHLEYMMANRLCHSLTGLLPHKSKGQLHLLLCQRSLHCHSRTTPVPAMLGRHHQIYYLDLEAAMQPLLRKHLTHHTQAVTTQELPQLIKVTGVLVKRKNPGPSKTQQAPGPPPNPYAMMYGQQEAWRGAPGYQQTPAAQSIASGYGVPYSAGQYAQVPAAYQQVYGHQQSGWGAQAGQNQQPSWAAAPQAAPAANGYSRQQPPLPDAAIPAQLAEVRPAHADVPNRKSVPTNVSPVEDLLRRPGRAKRPKLIAVVIRGLPGSGKSLIARRLRDAEVEAGGSGPRIHCIDDYFVTEVEKEVWEKDASGKQRLKRVQETEYCYEADMEGVYKASLLKAFRRTVEEGRSTFVIVDAPNPRVEDFKPYWDAGQRAGYEVYVLQAPETDPKVCFKRNVHGRTLEDIRAAARQWEAAPPSYPQLDPSWLLRPSGKPQAGITEVDMEDEVENDGAQLDPESLAAAHAKGRWASLDDGADVPQQKPKKMQKGRFAETAKAPAARSEGAWKPKKKVRWADEVEEEDTGFHIGGASLRQLETVYVLEGLGPPKEQSYGQKSFSDQVTAEHKSEQHNFRDILLGKRIPA